LLKLLQAFFMVCLYVSVEIQKELFFLCGHALCHAVLFDTSPDELSEILEGPNHLIHP